MSQARTQSPAAWRTARLVDVVRINPRGFSVPITDETLVSFVPMRLVEEESGKLDPTLTKPWSEVKKGYTAFQDGDVILAKITPCMENGKFALARDLVGGRAAGSTEFHVFRPSADIDPRYLLHFLFGRGIRSEAKRSMRGAAGQLRVPASFFEEREIPLPPLPEQLRIVAEIEKQFTRLDAGVAALRRAQANLKRYRASVLKAACEGKLVPTEAELARAEGREFEFGAALLERILVERRGSWAGRGQYKEPAAPNVIGLPGLPEGWCWATVEQVISELKNGYFAGAPSTNPPGTPTLRVSSVRAQRIDYDDVKYVPDVPAEKLEQYQLRVGDLLFTRYNGSLDLVGVCAVVSRIDRVLIYPDKLIRVRVPLDLLDAKYVELYMATEFPRKAIESFSKSTAGQQGISGAELKQIHVRLPPLAEQQRVVAEVERRLSVIDELEAVVAANLQRAARLRQAVLQRAFSGEL